MKAPLSEKTILFVSIIGLLSSLSISAFSIYNLSKNILPTLYVFIFAYSLFFTLGILYYLYENKIKKKKDELNDFSIFCSSRVDKILRISFYVVAILILIILNESLYIKPPLYYLLVSIAAVIIGLQIILKQEHDKNRDYTILFLQIIPLAIIIRGSSFLINPYLIGGPDVPWHFHSIQRIIEEGHLSLSTFHYYYYPSYHLTQSISGVILGFSKTTFDLINLTTSVVSIIIAYLIGKEVFKNTKASLMCSLLLSIATMHIFLVIYNASKIGGATLLLLCLLLLIKMHKTYNIRTVAPFWVSATALFFWHPEISLALMILLGGNFLTRVFIKRELELNTAFISYFVAFIGYLLYVHTSLFTSLVQSIFIEKQRPGLVQSFAGRTTTMGFLFQSFMAYLGITLPTFFVSYIGLKWLNRLNKVSLFIFSSLILLHMLPFIGITSGNFGLNPERILTYASILMTLIAAGAAFKIFKFENKSSVTLFSLVLFIFSFFSTSSYLIGDGNNVFNDEIPMATTFTTSSTLASYNFLNKTPEGSTIISDSDTIRYISNPMRGFFKLPKRKIVRFPSIEKGYFVINQPNLERLNWENSSWGEKVFESISNGNLLYNNGGLSIYKVVSLS